MNVRAWDRWRDRSVRINLAAFFSAFLWTSSQQQKIRKFVFGIYWDTWDCCGLFVLIFRMYILFIDLNDLLMEKNLYDVFLSTLEYYFYLYSNVYTHEQRHVCMVTVVASTC